MRQIVQNFKNGKLYLKELPSPNLSPGGILVQNVNSLISIGTEKLMLDLAKKSMIGKAKERPDQVHKVVEKIKKEGLKSTYQKVMHQLEEPKPLGYSCSGIVIEVGENCGNFQVGDRVACAGAGYANHAEFNFVPKNLAVKIPRDVSFEEAAYTTVGAIALQGIRQTEPNLGDVVFVMGLGLLGLITIQLLKANGCMVIGSDINPERVKLAKKLGIDRALVVGKENVIEETLKLTEGHGVDAVIISASTKSNEPIELSADLARHKGKVIALGMIPLDVPRNAYYQKELDLRLSMSYGPGRYDPFYEERGQDYPYAYVRWTERRNMQAILNLINEKKLNIKSLTSHCFKFENALEVYKNIMEVKEDYLGILFKYDRVKKHTYKIKKEVTREKAIQKEGVHLGLIGAGNYAGSMLYPHLKKYSDIEIVGVATALGTESDKAAKKYKARLITTDAGELLKNKEINTVLIATRHNLHAELTIAALKAKKHVFVEKPLALSLKELHDIKNAYHNSENILFVGYNRRFSPLAQKAKQLFRERKNPLNLIYRVNAGFIPKSHWVQDPGEGGGRVIGEVCHFVDFLIYLTDSKPIQVFTSALSVRGEDQVLEDNISVVLRFVDGSVGTIIYAANGDIAMEKEYIEIFGEGKSAVLNDFKELLLYSNGKRKNVKLPSQDKGQAGELKSFFEAAKGKMAPAIDFEELYASSFATFKILESLRKGQPVEISLE
jgi:predicted dehydrogenase